MIEACRSGGQSGTSCELLCWLGVKRYRQKRSGMLYTSDLRTSTTAGRQGLG
jgi:hypothetical protein